ncbi:PIN domain-containing protein [Caulobacter sp. SLTY]|uniref:type II toxin-antitoxin system VapC family toxin n=1 Tax=Caulobacter sp. SLTY TaxID=2683262 RepID=UPI001412C858|nr:type II toxin-antitoxin system VapC family toxin [Caulobacter sp. SLTY]NBB16807.1 PIN domain-containing protein [Caulobacter sp. SLTY]
MIVLDSSAVLAVLLNERGADTLAARLPGAVIGAANLAEVLSLLAERGEDPVFFESELRGFGLEVAPVTAEHALGAALIYQRLGRSANLSMGDRLCIALAQDRRMPILTADRAWARFDFGVPMEIGR